ncbi:PGF-pre-PGF domain-containing protein [Methanosarcina siciliae]|uniref:PGF-pre-PGF domain-containing protein n=1 Tax=Methanosarcina siciliae TaxID=38027 RepID=UPI000A4D0A20|nr:PGF-pre-PGF domain-containing protein [Methanosarcina siciliae]
MNEASSGDIIIVQPGNYPETVNITVPQLTFLGDGYPQVDGFKENLPDDFGGFNQVENYVTENITIQGFDITKTGVSISGKFGWNNHVRSNIFHGCGVSITVQEVSYGNTVNNNTFYGGETAVDVWGSGVEVCDNKIYDAEYGIRIDSMHVPGGVGEFSGNTVQGCDVGLIMEAASRIGEAYNNVFNNTENIRMNPGEVGVDEWNPKVWHWNESSPVEGTNIIDGPYIGGNYWGTPSGDGFSQTHLDTDGDGIAEEEYQISEGNVDYFPLVTPRVEQDPVANFNTNVTTGDAPLSVQFTDVSQNAASWNWNFGDGATSTENNPIHTYSEMGSYTVNLTVSNLNGTDSETAVITVLEKEEEENESDNDILPTANFTVNKTSGYYPLTVLFTDLSQNSTGRSWDVNNDGIEDSNESSFVYTYSSRGTYEAKLTAINANGTDIETTTITVEKKSSGGSSSGGGGGGGGGGSPEPAKNVEVKELSQVFITNGKAVKFEFKNNATCVVSVNFDAIRNAGKTTTIVEQLKNKSALVPGLPEGEVYKSFNVWVGNSGYATSKNIENPGLVFKVANSWIQDEQIKKDSITLSRYVDEDEDDDEDGTWTELNITQTGEDNKFLYFSAETPGYGSFAISGAPTLPVQEEEKITAESRAVGDIQESNETEEPESNKNKNTVLSLGVVTGALVVVMGLALKGMKK